MSDTAHLSDLELLANYTRDQAEDAFAELVRRHVDLVYSAALRQVRSRQLAEEVAQSAFTDLASSAPRLMNAPGGSPVLSSWLYQVTRRTAIDVVRREARRQLREQIATEMNATIATDSDWTHIQPLLDDAMSALDDTDRTAVLLRYFENKSLREVGATLGTSDDAAQKRCTRAVDRLREYFTQRGVTAGAGSLAVVISANAVQAAPIGLTATISTAALAGTVLTTTTTSTAIKTIAMTTLQKSLITVTIVAAVGAGLYEARRAATFQFEVQTLQQEQARQLPLLAQAGQLQHERDTATNRLADLMDENARLKKNPTEVLKLRGQVGQLQQEKATIGASSALNKITANPETRKLLRDQQKTSMTAIYKNLTKHLKLPQDQADKFNNLLADQVMEDVDRVTEVLRDGKTDAQINQVFADQDAALEEKLSALIGPDGVSQYKDYTRNLAGYITTEQFASRLTGDDAAKKEKATQLDQAIRDETQAALAAAGLPPDYQTVPMLNFRNIASETQGAQSLKMLDSIYERAAARASAFLSPEELDKFKEFRTTALDNSRLALTMNRKLMAPFAK